MFEPFPVLRHGFHSAYKTGDELLIQAENAALWKQMNIKGFIACISNDVEKVVEWHRMG